MQFERGFSSFVLATPQEAPDVVRTVEALIHRPQGETVDELYSTIVSPEIHGDNVKFIGLKEFQMPLFRCLGFNPRGDNIDSPIFYDLNHIIQDASRPTLPTAICNHLRLLHRMGENFNTLIHDAAALDFESFSDIMPIEAILTGSSLLIRSRNREFITPIIETLKECGADVNWRDEQGRSIYDRLIESGSDKGARILKALGGKSGRVLDREGQKANARIADIPTPDLPGS